MFELEKSSLQRLLCDNGILHAEGHVRTKLLHEEMSLVGFIPYTAFEHHNLVMNSLVLNDHLYVAPYLVKFSNEAPIYPYFKTITKATGNQYKIDNKLYIDPILNYLPSYYIDNFKHCNLPFNGKQLIPLINKKWDKKNMFIKNEDDTYNYVAQEDEWELSCGPGKIVAIANGFLCLCSYMNKVTGMLSYVALLPNDVIKVVPEDET